MAQLLRHDVQCALIVIDGKHSDVTAGTDAVYPGLTPLFALMVQCERHIKEECAAFTELALDCDSSPHKLH